MIKTYQFKLIPNKAQKLLLNKTTEVCRELYNDALWERMGAWKTCKKSISYYDQIRTLEQLGWIGPSGVNEEDVNSCVA